jgi:formiminotetrahydrofolate cyclodeaminase
MPSIGRALRRLLDAILGRGRDESDEVATMLAKQSLEAFTDNLAQAAPTPGGGSAAALAGALAAALVQMVCDLTIGREQYRAHDAVLKEIRRKAEVLRRDLLALVDRDAQAYDAVVAALRLPKGTEEERRIRSEALSRANLFATEIPMATADACAALLALAVEIASKGNVNAASDAGTGALLAYGGLRSAIMNIRTNLKGIKDEDRVRKIRDRVRHLEMDAEKHREETLVVVLSRTNGR